MAEISIDYKDLIDLSKFLEHWAVNLSKTDYQSALQRPDVLEMVTEYIAEEIREATSNDKFGIFMAERTLVSANPSAHGVIFKIYGETENQRFTEGKPARISEKAFNEGKVYNLWEMYEFHGRGITGVTLGEPGTKGSNQKIVKDTGGVVTVKAKSGETQTLKGRAGLISSVVSQLKPELSMKLAEFIRSDAARQIAEAGHAASSKARGIKGLDATMARAVKKLARENDVDLAKLTKSGVSVGVTSAGRVTTRGAGGKFVSSPLHGKVVRVRD